MKVLLATTWSSTSWTYLSEMVEELAERGIAHEVFDPSADWPFNLPEKVAFRIRSLRRPVTMAMLKRHLDGFATDFDVVNIHYADPVYCRLLPALKRRGRRLVTSIWGSEFLRATPEDLKDLGRILDSSHFITTNNPQMQQLLAARFPAAADRLRLVPFGLRNLEAIQRLSLAETRRESRSRLGLPTGKTIITLGYNATPEQQHRLIIQAVAALPAEIKAQLFALIPMTYPKAPDYQAALQQQMAATGVEFQIVAERLTTDNIARVRIVSDIVVNTQIDDSLSGSLQEHMFAGSTMILAEWLPYDIFAEMGVPMIRVANPPDITRAIISAVRQERSARNDYADKIYAYSSWPSVIDMWIELYGSAASKLGH